MHRSRTARLSQNGTNHGVELHKDVAEFAEQAYNEWRSRLPQDRPVPAARFVTGNAYTLNPDHRYDRIYVGAGAEADARAFFRRLLAPGGIMVVSAGRVAGPGRAFTDHPRCLTSPLSRVLSATSLCD